MNNFLESELSELPPGVQSAVLRELEQAVRAARVAIYHDKPDDINLRCITICAQLANTLEFASRLRSEIKVS